MNLTYHKDEALRLIKMAVPIFIGSISTTGMAFTDTLMAGRVSSLDLAGLSLATSIFILITIPMSAFMLGVTPIISADHGNDNRKNIHFHFYQLLYISVIISLISIAFSLSAPLLFPYLNLEPRVEEVATKYLWIVSAGIPFTFAFNSFRSLTDGIGKTKISMICCMLGLGINVFLNWVFIYGKFGFPAMGGIGCAVATAMVQFFMLVIQLFLTSRIRYLQKCAIYRDPPKPDNVTCRKFIGTGFPLAVAILLEIGIFSLFSLVVSTMGSTAMAANQIFFNYMTLIYIIPMSIANAVSIRIGYAHGANDFTAVRNTISSAFVIGLALSVVVGIASYILRNQIISIYTSDEEVKNILTETFICVSVYQIGDYCQTIGTGILRGFQKNRIILVMALITYWMFTVPVGLILCFKSVLWGPHGFNGLWIALCVSLYILAVAYIYRTHRIVSRLKAVN